MTKEIHQIEQDIAKLEQQTSIVKEKLTTVYQNYLNKLSEYVQKYLVFATYQICTQAYPQEFLTLSLSQRQNFQQMVRKLGQQAQIKLIGALEVNLNSTQSYTENTLLSVQSESASSLELTPQIELSELSADLDSELTINHHNIDIEFSDLDSKKQEINNPEQLVNWIQKLEKSITDILQIVSHDVNKLLLQNQIIPQKIPSKVLEAAAQIDNASSPIAGRPNLLNLLIESDKGSGQEKDELNKKSEITKITAIHLRLAEIEFSETTLSAQRNQIRDILAQVKKLRKQYKKILQELAIAQAEAAWRSSWYED